MQAIDSSAVSLVTHDAAPVICDAQSQPKKIVDLMREACAVRHYSRRTFQAYWHWSKRFILWSGKRHPREMGRVEVAEFLTWLATDCNVSASTQRQALHGILFMYQAALGMEIGWVSDIVHAKQPVRLPVVLTEAESPGAQFARIGYLLRAGRAGRLGRAKRTQLVYFFPTGTVHACAASDSSMVLTIPTGPYLLTK